MNILKNKKGAALMQVLLITAILAGIATMLLRASLSRTASARKTRRQVSAQVLIQSCMSQVNDLWTAKNPTAFYRDMRDGTMYCSNPTSASICPAANRIKSLTCDFDFSQVGGNYGQKYQVVATMKTNSTTDLSTIEYEITQGTQYL
ncbi:hypothetical protein [Candidatus Avelusimicrobium sp.]